MLKIIPYPNKVRLREGTLRLEGTVTVSCPERYADIAEDFTSALRRSLPSVHIEENGALKIDFNLVTDYGQEEYSLEVTSAGIDVRASKAAGFIYACRTLYQMLELHKFHAAGAQLPHCYISDKPRFRWRGLLLDEARHFFGKEEVLRLLEIMSMHKLNALCWHLSDDQGWRIESKRYPLLHEIGSRRSDTQIGGVRSGKFRGQGHEGFYTQEDVREIIAKAHSLGILVMPEISLPTHVGALTAAYPTLTCSDQSMPVATTFGDKGTLLCAGRAEVREFLRGLLQEICELFPSPYISVSAANLHAEYWLKCEACRKYMQERFMHDPKQLQTDLMNFISDSLKRLGRRMLCQNAAMADGMSRDIIGVYATGERDLSLPDQLRWGRSYIISKPGYLNFDAPYCSLPLRKTYEYDPDKELKGCRFLHGKVMGLQASLWTEWIYDREKLDLCLFPRMAALAEASWTEPSEKSWSSFKARLAPYRELLDGSGVNYAKDKICNNRNPLSRYRKLYYYNIMDQYLEVRENRK